MFVNSFSRAHDFIVAFVPEKAPSMFLDVVVRKVLADVNRKKHTHTRNAKHAFKKAHTHIASRGIQTDGNYFVSTLSISFMVVVELNTGPKRVEYSDM